MSLVSGGRSCLRVTAEKLEEAARRDCAKQSSRTEVSKIGQRSASEEGVSRERSGKSGELKRGRVCVCVCVWGAFNIFLVNLTAPFRFIAGLGVQVLSVRVRGRLIFNFISPSLHFIDGVACRRRHLSLTRACVQLIYAPGPTVTAPNLSAFSP